ncbi:MAG: hypothetical protein LRY56_05995 [Burkholderiaceae bacterium]|nr:hypothetical protein [Burkholderiaceae bacterium]
MSIQQQIEQILGSNNTDRRIPVVVLLGATAKQASELVLRKLSARELSRLVVFVNGPVRCVWPEGLRYRSTEFDELVGSQGCLCCAMRSELASALSQLFFGVLRRQEPAVGCVLIVTQAVDASVLAESLKHAPFLAQRYRLTASLPLASA